MAEHAEDEPAPRVSKLRKNIRAGLFRYNNKKTPLRECQQMSERLYKNNNNEQQPPV